MALLIPGWSPLSKRPPCNRVLRAERPETPATIRDMSNLMAYRSQGQWEKVEEPSLQYLKPGSVV